jgi:hypothetical protein
MMVVGIDLLWNSHLSMHYINTMRLDDFKTLHERGIFCGVLMRIHYSVTVLYIQ